MVGGGRRRDAACSWAQTEQNEQNPIIHSSQQITPSIFVYSLPIMSAAPTVEPPPSRDANSLLVDFPRGPAPPRRCVHFSPRSLLAFKEPPTDEERAALWYSPREQAHQKWQLRRDVSQLARKLASTPASLLREDELYHCVGNESCLSRDVLRSTNEHKDFHVRTVLAAQARQRAADVRDEGELSRLARASSAPACTRAHKIAVGYWHVLK